ncbi:hypothetical protein AXG93_3545s1130 [Marchantia polymorpha subsp. ruderalis]|uniref:Uncharacterized protein n=3 Tax=Marchantia polymorpha TaxID=3197 RepID=A0A176VVW2_MARPO|nr:hypothetical protein AXG93_3545s1130 [Marchantia polymorpha subsp. ruderalis]
MVSEFKTEVRSTGTLNDFHFEGVSTRGTPLKLPTGSQASASCLQSISKAAVVAADHSAVVNSVRLPPRPHALPEFGLLKFRRKYQSLTHVLTVQNLSVTLLASSLTSDMATAEIRFSRMRRKIRKSDVVQVASLIVLLSLLVFMQFSANGFIFSMDSDIEDDVASEFDPSFTRIPDFSQDSNVQNGNLDYFDIESEMAKDYSSDFDPSFDDLDTTFAMEWQTEEDTDT